MYTYRLKKSSTCFLAASGLILTACQPTVQPTASSAIPQTTQQLARQTHKPTVSKTITAPTQSPIAKVKVEPQISQSTAQKPLARVTLEITMPQSPRGDFSTQALAANTIAKLKLELVGPGISSPIYADGADGSGFITNAGGTFSISFSNVPYGAARRLSLWAYDNTDAEIPGATVKTAFAVGTATTDIELSFRTTPLSEILAAITGSQANQHLAENLDMTALQGFIDTLIGLGNTAPNYTYTTHPTLIDSAAIGTDLISNTGNIGALNSSNPAYKIVPGSVTFTLEGLINPDTATVVIRDPASGEVSGRSNGAGTINNVRPGTWKVEATAPGYTANTSPTVVVASNSTVDAGTISFGVSSSPNIASLSSSNGTIGSSLTLTGSNFHNSIAGNTVEFGSTIATITSASPTALVVTVPAGLSGTQNIKVTVGGNVSNTQAFGITPTVSSLSTTSGTIGSTLTLTGTGFSDTPAENTVRLNGVTASVLSATAAELVVTIPQASNGNITVQVGGQTSAGTAFNVLPTINLSAPAAAAVLSGNSTLGVNTTSGNTISKVEYFSGATKLGESTTAPYTFNWDTTTAASGAHTLTAKLTDAASNEVTSVAVSVTVNQSPVINVLTASLNPLPGLGHTTQLTCDTSDAEGTPTITWSTVGDSYGTFSSTTDAQVYWTSPTTAGGPYTIRCSVGDGIHTVTQDLSISVNSNTGNINGNGGLY